MSRVVGTLAFSIAILCLAACADDEGACPTTVDGLGPPICAELATTADQRRQGLTGREKLDSDEGLLIVFPTTDQLCIQNATVEFAIDAIWLADDGTVVATQRFDARADASVCHGPARSVLELAADARAVPPIGVSVAIDPPPPPAVE